MDRMNDQLTLYLMLDIESFEENSDLLQRNDRIKYAIDDFGQNLMYDHLVKYYDVDYIFADRRVFLDVEENADIIQFIIGFASENNKKLISYTKNTQDADYYVEESFNESTYH